MDNLWRPGCQNLAKICGSLSFSTDLVASSQLRSGWVVKRFTAREKSKKRLCQKGFFEKIRLLGFGLMVGLCKETSRVYPQAETFLSMLFLAQAVEDAVGVA